MKLNICEKFLVESMERLFPDADTATVVEELIRIGVVDPIRCKILLVRESVEALIKEGRGKVESMEITADTLCVSSGYVRKCMYYDTNINLPKKS